MKSKIQIKELEAKQLEALLHRSLPKGSEVYVFGSRANWTAKDHSDLDLLVDAKRPLSLLERAVFETELENSEFPYAIDLVDAHSINSTFRDKIEKQKKLFFSKDAEATSWEFKKLGELCALKAGDAFSKELQGARFGDVPFIKVSDMEIPGNERNIANANNWLNENAAKDFRVHPKDAVVFAKIGEALRSNRRRVLTRPTIIDNNMMAAVASKSVNPLWLYFLLETLDFNLISRGSALPYLAVSDLNNLEVKVPTLAEQQRIASALSALDDKIELNRRMNETLEGMAQAIFKDWFVDFGPVRRKLAGVTDPAAIMGGLTPARTPELAALFPDGFGEDGLPEGWGLEPLLDVAHWINGAAYKNMHFVPNEAGLPVIKIAELKSGVTEQTKFTNTDLGDKYRIVDGELLFSWSGNPDTSIDAFIWTGGEAWLNQHIFAVRENGSRTKPSLFVLLKYLMPEFAELARNKQTTGLGHVTKDDMKRLLVAKPSHAISRSFSEIVAPIFDKIVLALHENRALAETRDYLLPKLMSGQVRVRDVEKMV